MKKNEREGGKKRERYKKGMKGRGKGKVGGKRWDMTK